jgi:hypothetical protein
MSILLTLACNDERGNPSGRLGAIEIGGCMQFVAGDCRGPRFRFVNLRANDAHFRLFRESWQLVSHREWFGNWCCDGVKVRHIVVLGLLNHPLLRRHFTLEQGVSTLFDHWRSGARWTEREASMISGGG